MLKNSFAFPHLISIKMFVSIALANNGWAANALYSLTVKLSTSISPSTNFWSRLRLKFKAFTNGVIFLRVNYLVFSSIVTSISKVLCFQNQFPVPANFINIHSYFLADQTGYCIWYDYGERFSRSRLVKSSFSWFFIKKRQQNSSIFTLRNRILRFLSFFSILWQGCDSCQSILNKIQTGSQLFKNSKFRWSLLFNEGSSDKRAANIFWCSENTC